MAAEAHEHRTSAPEHAPDHVPAGACPLTPLCSWAAACTRASAPGADARPHASWWCSPARRPGRPGSYLAPAPAPPVPALPTHTAVRGSPRSPPSLPTSLSSSPSQAPLFLLAAPSARSQPELCLQAAPAPACWGDTIILSYDAAPARHSWRAARGRVDCGQRVLPALPSRQGLLPAILVLLLLMAPLSGAQTQSLTQLASHNSVPARECSGTCWPAAVEVRGSGFMPQQQDKYRCRFTGSADGSIIEKELRFPAEEEGLATSFARVVSDSVITCSIGSSSAVPMYSSQYFQVEVLFQNARVQWSDQASSEILFREIWTHTDCAGGACRGSAAGGSTFRVHGAGFNASNEYSCDFQAGPHKASTAAIFISNVQLECRVPAWPAAHGRVGFTVARSTGSTSTSPISFAGALAVTKDFTYHAS